MQEEDVDTVMHHVIGIVESFSKRSKGRARSSKEQGTEVEDPSWHATIAAAVRPFIFECAERFAVELESFLVSGLDIAAYDQRSKLSAPGLVPSTHSDEQNALLLSRQETRNAYDLYDEDVEEGVYVTVRTTSRESERFSSEESSETMKHHGRLEEKSINDERSFRRETEGSRPSKEDSIKHYVKDNDGNVDRGRSKHRRESRKKRKRSRSSSSRSSSPPKHKHRKRDKGARSESRKSKKLAKKKEKKSKEKKKHKRKSHKSRSRKRAQSSSESISDSDSPRSRGSLSPGERSARRTTRKRDQLSLEKGDSRKMQTLHVEENSRDRRRSFDHYRSSSEESRGRSKEDEFAGRSHGASPQQQPWGSTAQDSARNEEYVVDEDDRSHTLSPVVSPSIRPIDSTRRNSWDAPTGSTPPPSDDRSEEWVPSPENHAQRVEVIEQEAKTLETKLREQALANLMKHLNQTKNFSTPSLPKETRVDATVMTPLNQSPASLENFQGDGNEGFSLPVAEVFEPQAVLDTAGMTGGCLQNNNVSSTFEDAKHVKEAGKGSIIDSDSTTPLKVVEVGKVVKNSSETDDELAKKGEQLNAVCYGDATCLEGKDLVVELAIHSEPFDLEIPSRGGPKPIVAAYQKRKKRQNINRQFSRPDPKQQASDATEDDIADSRITAGQDSGMTCTTSPAAVVEEALLSPERFRGLSSVEADTSTKPADQTTLRGSECTEVSAVNPDCAVIASEKEGSGPVAQEPVETESLTPKKKDVLRPDARSKDRKDADEGGESEKFQQKSMSVTRGGESVQVNYKIYIPPRAAAKGRRLHR